MPVADVKWYNHEEEHILYQGEFVLVCDITSMSTGEAQEVHRRINIEIIPFFFFLVTKSHVVKMDQQKTNMRKG